MFKCSVKSRRNFIAVYAALTETVTPLKGWVSTVDSDSLHSTGLSRWTLAAGVQECYNRRGFLSRHSSSHKPVEGS